MAKKSYILHRHEESGFYIEYFPSAIEYVIKQNGVGGKTFAYKSELEAVASLKSKIHTWIRECIKWRNECSR